MRTARRAFRSVMGREPGRVNPFQYPIHQKAVGVHALPAAALFHYWHPDREGAEPCPPEFNTELHRVSSEVECVRPPGRAPIRSRCWLVWWRCARVTHRLSPGWLLILAWHKPDGTPLPLDNRVFANLYLQSRQVFGGGREYFDHIVADMKATYDSQQKDQQDYRHDRAKDLFHSQQISSAGRGNRFALHHDGTILPSRGEQAWRSEIDDHLLPPEIVRENKDRRLNRPPKSRA